MVKQEERLRQLKEKRPGYKQILDFYIQVRNAQTLSKNSLDKDQIKRKNKQTAGLSISPLSLIKKEDFYVSAHSSIALFHILCQIGTTANPHMSREIKKIEECITSQNIDIRTFFFPEAGEGNSVEDAFDRWGIDRKVLGFLTRNAIKPSIEAGSEELCKDIDCGSWRKRFCPVCSSPPSINLLKGEGGRRYSFCSFCSCQWRIDRLSCAACGTKEHTMLHYFYGDGEETCRVDLCDICSQYIKTIDYRNLEESDPVLEDLATLHLDVIAGQKGYSRTPSWGAEI